jgi:hypothetical protein
MGPKGRDTSAEGMSGLEAEGRVVTSPKGEWSPAGARIKWAIWTLTRKICWQEDKCRNRTSAASHWVSCTFTAAYRTVHWSALYKPRQPTK